MWKILFLTWFLVFQSTKKKSTVKKNITRKSHRKIMNLLVQTKNNSKKLKRKLEKVVQVKCSKFQTNILVKWYVWKLSKKSMTIEHSIHFRMLWKRSIFQKQSATLHLQLSWLQQAGESSSYWQRNWEDHSCTFLWAFSLQRERSRI